MPSASGALVTTTTFVLLKTEATFIFYPSADYVLETIFVFIFDISFVHWLCHKLESDELSCLNIF